MDKLLSVEWDDLMPDPTQPRKSFLKDELERLAASVAARGILQPLRIIRRGDGTDRPSWLIATGESRWRAAKLAGLKAVPCLVIDGQPDEADLLADRIIENACRNDLRPLELARALAKLKALKGYNSLTLAKELGISPAAITRAESLLSLPEDVQALVDSGSVAESTAYEISRLPDEQSQRELARAVADRRLNREAVTEAVRNRVGRRAAKKTARLVCRLDGGISVAISGTEVLTSWETLLDALDRVRKQARKLCDGGQEVSALARSLRAS